MNTRMRNWRASDGQLALGGAHSLAERTFRQGDIPSVRRFAMEFGTRAGMGAARLSDFVLAVSEAAACAVTRGPCTARLRLWASGAARLLGGPRRRSVRPGPGRAGPSG